jgi:UDP-N-acetylmuramoyl-tripeptide--D-alanyl-D-alanine ligase
MFKVTELISATGGSVVHAGSCANAVSISIDSRSIKKGHAFVAIPGKNFDGHDYISQALGKGAAAVIVRKGSRVARPGKTAVIEVPDTIAALGAIARFHRRRFNIPVIAITGSNGKTTTKDMLAWILSGRYKVLKNEGTKNNHIGVPMTLLQLDAFHRYAVVELGTNHFGEIGYLAGICEPTVAVITNIGPSHLEYFKDLSGVLKEKASIFRYLKKPGIGLMNSDDPMLAKMFSSRSACRPRLSATNARFFAGFGIERPCDFQARAISRDKGAFKFVMHDNRKLSLPTMGRNNIYNALAAISVSRVLGLGYSVIAARLKNFVFPGGRLTLRQVADTCFIDDTYNANPVSLAQAIEALRSSQATGRRVLVMGDMLELGSLTEGFHRDAGRMAAGSCDIFITVGKCSLAAASAAISQGFNKDNVFTCQTSAQAKDVLFNTVAVRKDDIVLLKGSRGMKLEKILESI